MAKDMQWIEIERDIHGVSLVSFLRDDLTKQQPRTEYRVRVDGEPPDTKTPSGYYVWFDLPESVVELRVDGRGIYEDYRRSVDLSNHSNTDPLRCSLVPSPAYQFPDWVTLVRGRIVDSAGDGIAGCSIELDLPSPTGSTDEYAEWRDRSVISDRDGYIAYYIPLAASLVDSASGEITIDGDIPTVIATHPDGQTETQDIAISHGEKAEVSIIFS